jgi:hypothetical protein
VSRDPMQDGVLVGEPAERGGEATEVSVADMLSLERKWLNLEKWILGMIKEMARTEVTEDIQSCITDRMLEFSQTVCHKYKLATPDIQM